MISKFRRIFPFLAGVPKILTEQSVDFLDSAIDAPIPVMHQLGVTNYFHAYENGFSYGGKWIFMGMKIFCQRSGNLFSPRGATLQSEVWR